VASNNLNRDQLWTSEVWADIDKAVLDEVGSIRVAQKVFPTTPMPGAANVPDDVIQGDGASIEEGRTQPFIEISKEFRLTQSQLDNETTLHTARTLAKLAAKSLALAEDELIFGGQRVKLPDAVKVVNKESARSGLLGVAFHEEIEIPADKANHVGESIFAAVTRGIAKLNEFGQPGPYALMMQSAVYADTYAPLASSLVTPADRLIPLLPGGFYGTGRLPELTALLVSLGGEPTTLFVATDAVTAYTLEDMEGRHRFRVFERIQFVTREHRALIRLTFEENKLGK
jgi:uncharacterized linocin/CFP29 family protein